MYLIQLIPSGDVFVLHHGKSAGPLHYSDWQTDDQIDTEKVEATHWNLDDEFTDEDYRVLHQWWNNA